MTGHSFNNAHSAASVIIGEVRKSGYSGTTVENFMLVNNLSVINETNKTI